MSIFVAVFLLTSVIIPLGLISRGRRYSFPSQELAVSFLRTELSLICAALPSSIEGLLVTWDGTLLSKHIKKEAQNGTRTH